MNKVISKKGISLVALVITIIVLIILTAAVVVTGINTPKNTEYAIKMHNQSAVQDAVTLYIMTSMLDGMDNYDPSTAGSYTVKDVDDIVLELYDIANGKWTENAVRKLGINLTQEELQAIFTLDNKGVVGWVEGQEPTIETKKVASIEIKKGINKTEYTVGEKVDITGLEVIATYEDGTTENVTSKCTYTPSLSQATATAGEKEIEVSYGDKTAIEKITITVEQGEPTLGSLINGGEDYGKTINYIVNADGYQFSDWKIYYEDEENGYVFIVLDIEKGDYYSDLWYCYASRWNEYYDVVDIPAIDQQKYKIFKLGNDGADITSESINEMLCSFLVNAFEGFANKEAYTNSNLESYVVGAMGGPTIEMFVAAYKEKTGIDLNLTIVDNGYKVEPENIEIQEDLDIGHYYMYLPSDELYIPTDYIYFLVSQGFVEDTVYIAGQEMFGFVPTGRGCAPPASIYPIVCLKSSMPAQLGSGETTDILLEFNGNVELMDIEITNNPTKTTYNVGEAIDMSGLVVTATYTDGSQIDVTDSITYAPVLTDITQTVGEKKITVTYEGQSAPQKITIKVVETGTLGDLITGGSMYGTAVTGYTAGGVSDWSVFYEEGNYVYLIASNVLTEAQIPTITGAKKGAYRGYGFLYWLSEPAVQTMSSNSIFKAEWSNYATNANGKCVSALLNTNNWAAFATPSDTTIQDYVVAAIGSPTAEMFAASWSAKNTTKPLSMTNINGSTTSTIGYYYNYNGTIDTYHEGLTTTGNELYFPTYNGTTTKYWLASPSAIGTSTLCGVGCGGDVDNYFRYNDAYEGVRPVVCLKSNIPATLTANGIEI